MQVLKQSDMVLLVVDATRGMGIYEHRLLDMIKEKEIPVVIVFNKADLTDKEIQVNTGLPCVTVSSKTREGINELKRLIIENAPSDWCEETILGDIVSPGETVVLVVPVDMEAPKGRLILPQVQTIRDVLDHGASAVVVKEDEYPNVLRNLKSKPALVVTDSQAFHQVAMDTPLDILLTSFSILFARYKGDLDTMINGTEAIDGLRPGDRVLIMETCTHHPIGDDIGRVKIPRWLNSYIGGELNYDYLTGRDMPEDYDLKRYKLIIHCGACMINRREMLYRISRAMYAGVPIVNYGVIIAYLNGILERVTQPFEEAYKVGEVNHQ
jgi:iron-only hydrogenase maturation protein HydF